MSTDVPEASIFSIRETPDEHYEYKLVTAAFNCAVSGRNDWMSLVTSWFSPIEFLDIHLKTIYEVLCQLMAEKAPVSDDTLACEIPLEGACLRERAKEMYKMAHDSAGQGPHVLYYARKVHDAFRRRSGATDITRTADDLRDAKDVDVVFDRLPDLRNKYAPAPQMQAHDNMDVFQDIVDEIEGKKRKYELTFGIDDLDRMIPGLAPGNLTTITGAWSSGKSILLLQMAIRCAREFGRYAMFYSFEMTAKELIMRGAAHLSGIPMTRSRKPQFQEGLAIMRQLLDPSNGKLRIITGARTIESIHAESKNTAAMVDLGFIGIDYIQITTPTPKEKPSREQEIAHVVQGMKAVAMDVGVPVMTASQLNEKGQTRESRAIEQSSNIMIQVDPQNDESDDCKVDLHVRKNRDGGRGLGEAFMEKPLFTIRDQRTVEYDTFDMDEWDKL